MARESSELRYENGNCAICGRRFRRYAAEELAKYGGEETPAREHCFGCRKARPNERKLIDRVPVPRKNPGQGLRAMDEFELTVRGAAKRDRIRRNEVEEETV